VGNRDTDFVIKNVKRAKAGDVLVVTRGRCQKGEKKGTRAPKFQVNDPCNRASRTSRRLTVNTSILLLSPSNQVLLLHRVHTSTSFASAHVFPGGNLSSFHEGEVPPLESHEIHKESEAYRLAAVRETFEESGLLLARKRDESELLSVPSEVLEVGRKEVHGNRTRFIDWLQTIGGTPDLGEFPSQIRTSLSLPG